MTMLCQHHAANPPLQYLLTSTSGLRIRHIVHVCDLSQTLLTTDLSSTLPAISFILDLSPFNVGFVQLFRKTAIVRAIRIVSTGVLK